MYMHYEYAYTYTQILYTTKHLNLTKCNPFGYVHTSIASRTHIIFNSRLSSPGQCEVVEGRRPTRAGYKLATPWHWQTRTHVSEKQV